MSDPTYGETEARPGSNPGLPISSKDVPISALSGPQVEEHQLQQGRGLVPITHQHDRICVATCSNIGYRNKPLVYTCP